MLGISKVDDAMKDSLSYKEFWGLPEAPFENTTDPKFYFPSAKHEEGVQCLLYGIKERKGAVLLSGEIGCGKTILTRQLVLNLPQEQFDIALIANPTFEATEFLRELLCQLGLQPQGSKMALLHHLNNHLLKNSRNGVATVVVVDEAQAIQDERVFEEIRLLLNFQLNERFLLTLVILGQPEIQDRLLAIPQLSQRIAIRTHLLPLNGDETQAYVQHRLKIGGCQRPIFTKEAMLRIFSYTKGIARKINTLCDLSLLKGCQEKAHEIDEGVVDRANGCTLSWGEQDRPHTMTRFSDVVRQQDLTRAERPLPFQPDRLDQFSSTPFSTREDSTDPGPSSPPTESDPNWYDYVQLELEHIAGLVKQKKVISTERLRTGATGVVQSLQKEEKILVRVFSPGPDTLTIVSHSINVALVATKIGIGLSFTLNRLIDLGMAGLLHDVGKFLRPESVITKTEKFDKKEEAMLRRHSEFGHQIINKSPTQEPWLADVILQVHERWGGQGYPQGLKGEAIHEYAQIIGLADRFETLVNREATPPHEAIRLLLTHERNNFPGHLLKVLVQQVSLFPIGTVVRLSTGEIGTVKKTNPQYPMKPILSIKRGTSRGPSPESTVRDLSQDHLVHIVGVVKEGELVHSSGS